MPEPALPKIEAPFSDEQVINLNAYQRAGYMHPFTCGKRDEHLDNEGILVAHISGWKCPAPECDYTQHWAHAFMAEPPRQGALGV